MSNLTEHQAKVLQKLKDAGLAGLNSYSEFRKDNALQISGTIRELREKGYSIRSVRKNGDRSATYILLHPTPLTSPSGQNEEKPAPQLIPRPQGWVPEAQSEPTTEMTELEKFANYIERSIEDYDRKLEELREEWRQKPSMRAIIERRAQAIKNARAERLKKTEQLKLFQAP